MTQLKRVHVVINPASGDNQPILNTLNDTFAEHDVDWDVSITHKRGDGVRQAKQAMADGFDIIAAYGGDGTVNEVAAAVAGTQTPLAILPGGTGNAVAHNFGIPLALPAALDLLLGEHAVLPVDLGFVGDSCFLLHATIGLLADASTSASRPLKESLGNLAYVLSGVQHIQAAEPTTYQLTLDDRQVEAEAVGCLILNIPQFGPHLSLPGDVRADDGKLDLLLLTDASVKLLSQLTGSMLIGGKIPDSVQHWQFETARIEAQTPQATLVDGERVDDTPADVTVSPGALRLIVPPNHPTE